MTDTNVLDHTELFDKTMLGFGQGMSARECDDVRNYILMAERVARAKNITTKTPREYYELCSRMMGDFGWATLKFDLKECHIKETSLALNELVIRTLKLALNTFGEGLATMAEFVQKLALEVGEQVDKNPDKLQLWLDKKIKDGETSFDIALCAKSPNGSIFLCAAMITLPKAGHDNANVVWEWKNVDETVFNCARVLSIGTAGLERHRYKIDKALDRYSDIVIENWLELLGE